MTDAAWLELDLPRPPSVNRFLRKLGNKTPCVRAWVGEADYHLWVARKVRRLEPVRGPFEVELEFRRSGRGDLGNNQATLGAGCKRRLIAPRSWWRRLAG
jgi:hypothetical protein